MANSQAIGYSSKSRDEYYRPFFRRVLDLERLGYSQQRIAELFNGEGLTTISGSKFNQPRICRIVGRARELQDQGLLEASPGETVEVGQ